MAHTEPSASAPLLDRVIGYFAPGAALRRHFERAQLTRAYEAASPRDPWRPRRPGASANADHLADASLMRSKARALYQNVPWVRAGLDGRVSYIIGSGIVHRSLAKDGDTLDTLFRQWTEVADADGRLDYYGLQSLIEKTAAQDGECLIRKRYRRPQDGLPVPLQLQVLEIDWLNSSKNGPNGPNMIYNGIEYDPIGRVVSYWLWSVHPGEISAISRKSLQSYPVPAADVIHYFDPERPGQGRGFSRLAPIIAGARDLSLYEGAEIARKNLESRLSVLISGDPTIFNNPNEVSPTDSGGADLGDLGDLRGGGITRLPPGVNTTIVAPNAAPGYTDYVREKLMHFAAGMGSTYELATGDVSQANFSSMRARRIDFKRQIEAHQWKVTIPRLCRPVHQAFIDTAHLAGKTARLDYACDFSTPKWDYVNPEQDIDAELKEVAGGLASFSGKLRSRGYDPETVFNELEADIKNLQSRGILETMLSMLKAVPQRPAAPAEPAPASKSKAN